VKQPVEGACFPARMTFWYDQYLKTDSLFDEAGFNVPVLLMPAVSLSKSCPSFKKIRRADLLNPLEGLLFSRLPGVGKVTGPITDHLG
jgi:hypothetical protein